METVNADTTDGLTWGTIGERRQAKATETSAAVVPACRGRRLELRPWGREVGGGTSRPQPLPWLPLLVLLRLERLFRRKSSYPLAVLLIVLTPIAVLLSWLHTSGASSATPPLQVAGPAAAATGARRLVTWYPTLKILPMCPLSLRYAGCHHSSCSAMGSSGSKTEPPSTAQQVEVRLADKASAPKVGKSGKKICCSCPETKAVSFAGGCSLLSLPSSTRAPRMHCLTQVAVLVRTRELSLE